uniref:Uncharacterized protein n=1 Tax=Quercus lobata TaxID=97700 RepID=A0A7N2QX69_QUELO
MVLKCGRGFLFPQELEEFGQTIIECSTDEPSHNMDFIHQSVATDTPNDKQKSEAGCSYEDPYPGRLRRLLFLEQIIRSNIYFEDQHPDNQLHQNDLMYARIIQKLGFPAKFKYEPELFPGLIYRMKQPKIVLLIFVSGKIVHTGAKVISLDSGAEPRGGEGGQVPPLTPL